MQGRGRPQRVPHPRLASPWLATRLLAFLAAAIFTPTVYSQEQYVLQPGSLFESSCIGPSPCDCAAPPIGPVQGSFELQPILPPLGPIFEFQVLAIDWVVDAAAGPIPVTGSGLYAVDVIALTHIMSLDLVVGGVASTFTSTGAVPGPAMAPPDDLAIDVFHMVDSCIYDGFRIVAARPRFRRGDCSLDGSLDIADAVDLLGKLFDPAIPVGPCPLACDANDDGSLDLADAVTVLNHLFLAAGPLPAPHPGCGTDPTPDGLSCSVPAGC